MRKMRNTAPRRAPMVRKTAMSRVLSFTIMMSELMTLKAATRMISVRMRKHHVLLDLDGGEEAVVVLLPVDDLDRRVGRQDGEDVAGRWRGRGPGR